MALFDSFIARRAAREPLAYITGVKEFWSLAFEVSPDVLIPRPETETIVEQVLARFPDPAAPLAILDLGTGSGCLLAALLKEYPGGSGLGVDCSPAALALAGRNLARHGLAARAELARGDWFEGPDGDWDVIVSNPPYIPSAAIAGLAPEVRDFEPRGALDGGPDGLNGLRALAAGLRRRKRGLALVEIGAGQSEAAAAVMAAAGLSVDHIAPDLVAIPRVLVTELGPKKRLE